MQTAIEESLVTQKTKELCQALLDQPDIQSIRERINSFMSDDQARAQYDALVVKGDALQQKQQMGAPLSEEEIAAFESHRDQLLANPVAKGFLDAQKEMHKVQETLSTYVVKTFELGRVPATEDLDLGCGSGCGCH